MSKFRKKPVVIEAEQFLTDSEPLPFRDLGACCYSVGEWYVVTIHGQETKIVDGDWIIMEPDGEHFYPCKPDIFEQNYEASVECTDHTPTIPEGTGRKDPANRTDEDLVQTALELYARSGRYPQSKGLHDACVEARNEILRRLAKYRSLEKYAKVEPVEYCDICPHALWAHNPDGSCGCGMDCANERRKAGK